MWSTFFFRSGICLRPGDLPRPGPSITLLRQPLTFDPWPLHCQKDPGLSEENFPHLWLFKTKHVSSKMGGKQGICLLLTMAPQQSRVNVEGQFQPFQDGTVVERG